LFEFLKTSLNALKNIQYNIAIKVRTTITSTLLKIHSAIENTIAIRIHKRMLRITPPIPSPTSISSEEVKFDEMVDVSTVLNLSIICPRLSLSLIPLKSPIVMKRKNAIDKIVVEISEFSKNVLCRPRPQK
jgi:hypothetical protein